MPRCDHVGAECIVHPNFWVCKQPGCANGPPKAPAVHNAGEYSIVDRQLLDHAAVAFNWVSGMQLIARLEKGPHVYARPDLTSKAYEVRVRYQLPDNLNSNSPRLCRWGQLFIPDKLFFDLEHGLAQTSALAGTALVRILHDAAVAIFRANGVGKVYTFQ